MDDSERRSLTATDRRSLLRLAGATGLAALAGCLDGGAGDETPTRTATATSTDTPTDTEKATETEETETETETETDVRTVTPAEGPLSRPPEPPRTDVPRPDGEPGNLTVLDWAGFDGAVTYTFDDSQPSHVEHYDALHATGVDVTFYLSSNVEFEGYEESWKQVVADGHEIGNHTVSHPRADLTESSFGEPLESTEAEIEECSAYITDTLGQRDVWTLAAPFGDEGWVGPARESDLFLNRGVQDGTVAPGDGTDPYKLPCYLVQEGDTAETFNGKIDAARAGGEWLVFLFHTITPTEEEWYAPVNVEEVTASMEHATATDGVWVDTLANVGAYWRGQQLLESASVTESDGETVWNWDLPSEYPTGQTVRVTVDGGTLKQGGDPLEWNSHGYYEVAMDAGTLKLTSE